MFTVLLLNPLIQVFHMNISDNIFFIFDNEKKKQKGLSYEHYTLWYRISNFDNVKKIDL